MKVRSYFRLIATVLFAALAIPTQLTAQDGPNNKPKHHQYRLYDVGTFGGPQSGTFFYPSFTVPRSMNNRGVVVGFGDTALPDPYPDCFTDCFLSHGLRFQYGALTDLGALPGDNGAIALGLNENGLIVGASENGSVDSVTGFPEFDAVLWKGTQLTHLENFGGSQSQAIIVNNQGLVAGVAANTIPDPYASGLTLCIPLECGWTVTTQQRAVVWQNKHIHDLGTLGGNDAVAYLVNESGQVAGVSYTDTIPTVTTGVPTQHAFLWERGNMIDLGTFGGSISAVRALNSRGQVAGYATFPGDQVYHPSLWSQGKLIDLGSFGGDLAAATGVNDAGTVAGVSYLPDNFRLHALVWRRGLLTDLGTIAGDDCSTAYAINNSEQILGSSYACDGSSSRASLWENNAPPVDMNALVNPPSNVSVTFGLYITNNGNILAGGLLSNGDVRLVVLVPDGDCGSNCEDRIAESERNPPTAVPNIQNPNGLMMGRPGLGGKMNPFPGLPFRVTTDKQR